MIKCFANNQTLLLKGTDQYFESQKAFFAEDGKKNNLTHTSAQTWFHAFLLLCVCQIHMSREESRKKCKCSKSLEIHLDIWSPSERAWSAAKHPPNKWKWLHYKWIINIRITQKQRQLFGTTKLYRRRVKKTVGKGMTSVLFWSMLLKHWSKQRRQFSLA